MFVDLKLKCVGPVRIKEVQEMGAISPLMAVRSMKQTIEFYNNTLGFEMEMVFPDAENPEYVAFAKDEMHLMFLPVENAGIGDKIGNEEKLGIGVNIYLAIDGSIDEYYAEVKNKGVNIVADIKDEPFGIRDFTIKDINGYQLTFNQRIQSN